MAAKTEVYAWRVAPATKARLEETARARNRSVAQLLDDIVHEHLAQAEVDTAAERARQQRLHARVARTVGVLAGEGEGRSARTRELVRARLNRGRVGAR